MAKTAYPEPVAGAFIVNRKGEILLVKSGNWNGKWVVPGGHVELGERIVDALRREVMEEVGLKINVTRLLSVQEAIFPKGYSRRAKSRHMIFFDFLCEPVTSKVKADKAEVSDFKWVKPSEAKRLKTGPYVKHALDMYAKAENIPLGLEEKLLKG